MTWYRDYQKLIDSTTIVESNVLPFRTREQLNNHEIPEFDPFVNSPASHWIPTDAQLEDIADDAGSHFEFMGGDHYSWETLATNVVQLGIKSLSNLDDDKLRETVTYCDEMGWANLSPIGFRRWKAEQLTEAPKVPVISPEKKQEAAAKGFDTTKLWFHGSRRKFDSFQIGKGGLDELGKGLYFTGIWSYANTWARQGGYIYECYIKEGPLFNLDERITPEKLEEIRLKYNESLEAMFGGKHGGINSEYFIELYKTRGLSSEVLGRSGYIGAFKRNSQIPDQVVVFDPANVFIAARGRGGHFNDRQTGPNFKYDDTRPWTDMK